MAINLNAFFADPAKADYRKTIVDRYWSYVDVRGELECWPWRRAVANLPGVLGISQDKRQRLCQATHIALVLDSRPVPANPKRRFALHSCDNPPCCNPKHLRWGTHMENVQDRMDRNRAPRCFRAKLTDDQVRAIRSDRRSGTIVGAEYGLRRGAIWMIRTGKTYRDVI